MARRMTIVAKARGSPVAAMRRIIAKPFYFNGLCVLGDS